VYIRDYINTYTTISGGGDSEKIEHLEALGLNYSATSVVYSMVVCAVIPILCIYPFIQKYFAKGVNMGGVKE
jgi:putative aldouronate transport system permease protein